MKKKSKPKRRNTVAKDLRTPKYRMRVEEQKNSYQRTPKHRKEDYVVLV